LLLASIVIWAYGQVITKRLKTLNFIHVNIHLGMSLTLASGILYPVFVKNPTSIGIMIEALIWCGIPSTFSSFCFIGAITISKQTGILTLFQFISVIIGYFVSIFRYNESLNILCIIGTIFLLIGLFKAVLNKEVR
jgi:drug/metabolite transporter (DMT)-like permease